ncbi:hypothetical protein ISTM_324 [Insectomime virus]|uniref:Uncharacterized protein n=1 Tax=Tunisvirus fontaine2 TaxID=1421067 RepID=V9SE52_9VIRU|nr:hypothetical protein D1R32_gp476 [Tunisvirus fontaine2]AHA46222.1 hypothetical protein ISTM_324 [Insectomime virus]AHC55193.1 hypothetical protein TNS_ORF475 [Tunisvirus fontaine2]
MGFLSKGTKRFSSAFQKDKNMASVLLPKVLEILKERLIQESEIDIERYETPITSIYIFTDFSGFLCSWREEENGVFRERSDGLVRTEEEMFECLKGRIVSCKNLEEIYKERRSKIPGFHLESKLLPSVFSLLKEFDIEEEDFAVSYAYAPGGEPNPKDIVQDVNWVVLYLKGSKGVICRWLETYNGCETQFFSDDCDIQWVSTEHALGSLKKIILRSSAVCSFVLEKLGKAKEQILELEKKNQRLRERVAKYKYAPEGEKAREVQRHFQGLCQ